LVLVQLVQVQQVQQMRLVRALVQPCRCRWC
jgi:hypothetical protein